MKETPKGIDCLVHFSPEMPEEQRIANCIEEVRFGFISFDNYKIKVPEKEIAEALGMELVKSPEDLPGMQVYDVSKVPSQLQEEFERQLNEDGYAHISELRFLPVYGLK